MAPRLLLPLRETLVRDLHVISHTFPEDAEARAGGPAWRTAGLASSPSATSNRLSQSSLGRTSAEQPGRHGKAASAPLVSRCLVRPDLTWSPEQALAAAWPPRTSSARRPSFPAGRRPLFSFLVLAPNFTKYLRGSGHMFVSTPRATKNTKAETYHDEPQSSKHLMSPCPS